MIIKSNQETFSPTATLSSTHSHSNIQFSTSINSNVSNQNPLSNNIYLPNRYELNKKTIQLQQQLDHIIQQQEVFQSSQINKFNEVQLHCQDMNNIKKCFNSLESQTNGLNQSNHELLYNIQQIQQEIMELKKQNKTIESTLENKLIEINDLVIQSNSNDKYKEEVKTSLNDYTIRMKHNLLEVKEEFKEDVKVIKEQMEQYVTYTMQQNKADVDQMVQTSLASVVLNNNNNDVVKGDSTEMINVTNQLQDLILTVDNRYTEFNLDIVKAYVSTELLEISKNLPNTITTQINSINSTLSNNILRKCNEQISDIQNSNQIATSLMLNKTIPTLINNSIDEFRATHLEPLIEQVEQNQVGSKIQDLTELLDTLQVINYNVCMFN